MYKLKIALILLMIIIMITSSYITIELMLNDSDRYQYSWLINYGDAHVHYHQWIEPPVCGGLTDYLKIRKDFPHNPSLISKIDELIITTDIEDSGQRIFGYIKPTYTDEYTFAITSSGNSEFWLSTDSNVANAKLLAWIGQGSQALSGTMDRFDNHTSQQSHQIHLVKGRSYYFDLLHTHGYGKGGFLRAAWKCNRCGENFKAITKKNLRFMQSINDSNMLSHAIRYESRILPLPHTDAVRDNFTLYPYLDTWILKNIFPTCPYKPSFVGKRIRKISSGLQYAYYTAVFPDDSTVTHTIDGKAFRGNLQFRRTAAMKILNKYTEGLKNHTKGQYKLHQMVNIEEKYDSVKGHRYLVEILVSSAINRKIYRISQYVYLPKGSTNLCLPENISWKNDVDVHFLVTVKNQAYWVQYFIDRMSEIYVQNNDQHFTLTFVDFQSDDINLLNRLRRSKLKRFNVISLTSNFSKSIGMQKAANSIRDQNSIIVQLDLHLAIPDNFLENIRKHTVQGKMVYFPMVFRLTCNYRPLSPIGFWERYGFGINSFYKSDFDRIGGMDTEKFRYSWGGEDNDLVNRAIASELEVERMCIRNFFHFYHRRNSVWNLRGKSTYQGRENQAVAMDKIIFGQVKVEYNLQ